MKWIKHFILNLKYLIIESRLRKRIPELHRELMEQHQDILAEIKTSKRALSYDLTDVLLKLDALSDNLETTLQDLKDEDDTT